MDSSDCGILQKFQDVRCREHLIQEVKREKEKRRKGEYNTMKMILNNFKVFLDMLEKWGFTLQIEIMISAISVRFDFTNIAVRNF